MALGILESREWDRHLKTPEDRAEYVAKLIPNLAKLLPIHDLNALRLLRLKLLYANVNWRSRCEKWETQWLHFLTDENEPYDRKDKSGRDIYAAWLQYAAECHSKGEPPVWSWDEEPFSEFVQSDSIITPPKTLFRLDVEIVVLLGEVHIWGMATLDEHYRKRVDLLLSAILYRSNFYVVWDDVKSQTGTVLDWIRDGIETLLRATDQALFNDAESAGLASAVTQEALLKTITVDSLIQLSDSPKSRPPAPLLRSWSEICEAVGRDNDEKTRGDAESVSSASVEAQEVSPKEGGLPSESRKQKRYLWIANAMMLVKEHPDWSDARIAREVGVDPAQLTKNRCPEYQAAAGMARNGTPRRGHLTSNPDSGTTDIEAEDDDDPAKRDWD